jgi:flagellar basal body-associated protein FliL
MRRILISSLLACAVASPALGSSGPEKKTTGGLSYVVLPTLTASMIRGDGRRRVLTVQAGLDVPDAKLRDRAIASQPRLRDAYVRVLASYANAVPPLGPPNPETVAAGLQRATDQVLGRPGARLLLGTIMVN